MNIGTKIKSLKNVIPDQVSLVAVSKTKSNDMILEAFQEGQLIFGENKVQELVSKYQSLPKEIEWHMIGHLQSKKVKHIAPFISLIHSVDTIKLVKEIDKRAKQNNRSINCLIQVHIAQEQSKYGVKPNELITFLDECKPFENVTIIGLMGMATFSNDLKLVESEFKILKQLFDKVKIHQKNIRILSMGMSGDYQTAIQQGSNMIRIGSTIFGHR